MKSSSHHPRLTTKTKGQPPLILAALLVAGLLLSTKPVMRDAQAVVKMASSQPKASWQQGTKQSLASILNNDGTVNLAAGITGSFDVNGYRMELGTNGEPRFVPKAMAACADNWDDRFGLLGTNGGTNFSIGGGSINAIATDGSGNVYIGGQFMNIGNVIASNIAKWDGTAWSALGDGSNR